MGHLQHFPHSHGHLLSFSFLAVSLALVVVNTAVAEDASSGHGSDSAPATSAPSESFKMENNQPPQNFENKNPNGSGPNMEPGNQPFANPPMDENRRENGSNNFGAPGDKNFAEKNFADDKFGSMEEKMKNFGNFEDKRKFDNNNQPKNNQFNGQDGSFDPNGQKRMMNPEQTDKMMNGNEGNQNQEEQFEKQQEQFDKQMVLNAQHQIKQLEQQLRQFDKKVQTLTKQGLTVPAEFSAALTKVKGIIAAVKSAKTADELEAAGWDDIRDEMNTLFENQKVLEQLAHWPQALKMVDGHIRTQTKNLAKYKSLAEKLQKKDVDVSVIYSELESSVNSLKTIRDEAVAKVGGGDVETAFEVLEDKFYDVFESVQDKQGIMQTLSNIGQFSGEFKKAQKIMTKAIATLKKKKVNTAELEQLQTDFNRQGQEVKDLIKARPIDMEAITDALEDLFTAKDDFIDKKNDLNEGADIANNNPSSGSNFQF